jgi:tetratricopeptide (TPR) repeat protein
MRSKLIVSILSFAVLGAAAACGGSPKSGLQKGTKDVPPPPDISAAPPDVGAGAGVPEVKREISEDAKGDYAKAAEFYSAQTTWSESTCRQAADKFSSVARAHKTLVEAQYMVGRSYHNCNLAKEAEEAYQAALKIKPEGGGVPIALAASISNIGELYFAAGKADGAKQWWEKAIKANPKLAAAYVNLAVLQLDELRRTKDNAAWKKLEEDTRKKLSISLAIDNENVRAYTVYGLVYMEGFQKNRNRLDLAKLLLEEGEKRNAKYAPLQHALGLLALNKNNLTDALGRFQAAVELDSSMAEARQNVGLITLGTRRYDVAKEQFQKVLELDSKNYDAMIGLGVAQRGLGEFKAAEDTYNKAKALDGRRGEAYYNLGVLYKAFLASKENDLTASQEKYRTAKKFFEEYLRKSDLSADDKEEAQQNIKDCDKVIKQIDEFKKMEAAQKAMMNNQPPAPAPTPAPK